MAEFWFATFALSPEAPAQMGAVEVIRTDDKYIVLFSTVDSLDAPTKAVCQIGFANSAHDCAFWHDRGFPIVDATINLDGETLRLQACFFGTAANMTYETAIASIAGIKFAKQTSDSCHALGLSYEQEITTPDCVFPATWVAGRTVVWPRHHSAMTRTEDATVRIAFTARRYPALAPFDTGEHKASVCWAGTVKVPHNEPFSSGERRRARRVDTFGVPAFRFEDVEILGFRIDLSKHGTGDCSGDLQSIQGLSELAGRLNFHLVTPEGDRGSTDSALSDFRYRPASRVLRIEVLRYGKMRLKRVSAPLQSSDFQSQHEMMVRMLVGRVDDDTAQARDPATFVPVIFVDNPWSKILGRAEQGFDKRLADFCVASKVGETPTPLLPDGRRVDDREAERPHPLRTIKEVRLATGTDREQHKALVKFAGLAENCDGWDDFTDIDLDVAFGPLTPTRWRQSDFDAPEFRRSFARAAMTKTLHGFRSIQVAPVGTEPVRAALAADTTWIEGTFDIDRGAQIAWPNGTARLTLCAPAESPTAWRLFVGLLGAKENNEVKISLPRGSWYRMRCSMSLDIDDA